MAEETVTTESTAVAEATPASEAPKPIKDLKDYSSDERKEWLKTGKLAEDQQAEKEAAEKSKLDEEGLTENTPESSTGESESAAKAENASESDPDSKKAPKKGKTAEDRKAQLAAEIQELLEQRKKLREELKPEPKAEPKQDAKPESSTEAKKDERPVKPKIDDFEKYEDYEEARDKYFEELAEWKADQKLKSYREEQAKTAEENQQKTAQQERLEKWNKSIREAKQEWPDFEAVVHDLKPTAEVMEYLEESEYRAQILYRLGEDMDNASKIFGLSKAAQLREIVEIEREFRSEAKKQEPPKKEPTPISKAPKPPVNLRGGSSPGDPELAAVSANDFVAYEKAANAKELARRRGA